jgi:hypothetical protein
MCARSNAAPSTSHCNADYAQPDQICAAAKLPSPQLQKIKRRIGGVKLRLGEASFQENRQIQCSQEMVYAYQSHRRYVHSLIMAENSEPKELSWESNWKLFESIIALADADTTTE